MINNIVLCAQLPDAKGYTSMLRHLLKVSDEERQMRRDQILGTTAKV